MASSPPPRFWQQIHFITAPEKVREDSLNLSKYSHTDETQLGRGILEETAPTYGQPPEVSLSLNHDGYIYTLNP